MAKKKATRKKTAKRKTAKKKTAKKATKKKKAARKKTTRKKTAKKRKAGKKAAKKKVKRKKASKKKTTKKRTTRKKKTKKKAAPKRKKAKKKTAKRKTSKRKAPKKKTTRKKTAKKKKAKRKTAKRKTAKKKAAKKKTTKRKAVKKKTAKKKTAKKKTAKKATKKKTAPGEKEHIPTLDLEQFQPEDLVEHGAKDRFFGSTKYAWIGSGQCGGRIAKAFYDLGYGKSIAVNTTHHDLNLLDIPSDHKFLMDIGEKGAGKDMKRGKSAVTGSKQDILHLARQKFGTEVDHIMVTFGAGGGTGGGSAPDLVDVAKNYSRSIGHTEPSKHVGVMMTIPTVGEGASPQVARNAYEVATQLGEMANNGLLSPLIIIDNEKISKMYPGMTVKSYWDNINNTVSGLFDVFNKLNALSSRYTTFDPVDYQSILHSSGCCIMGLTRVTNYQDRFALSEAVRKNLEKTLLCDGFDLETAKVAGCIMVGGKKMMANVPGLQDNMNFAFDVLADITGNATIHRGIYEDNKETLRVYTIISGLDFPQERIEEVITPA